MLFCGWHMLPYFEGKKRCNTFTPVYDKKIVIVVFFCTYDWGFLGFSLSETGINQSALQSKAHSEQQIIVELLEPRKWKKRWKTRQKFLCNYMYLKPLLLGQCSGAKCGKRENFKNFFSLWLGRKSRQREQVGIYSTKIICRNNF